MYLSSLLSKLLRYGKFKAVFLTLYYTFKGENFHKLVDNVFCGENFRRLLVCAANRCHAPQISQRKLSQIATKPQDSQKLFSLESFPLLGVL